MHILFCQRVSVEKGTERMKGDTTVMTITLKSDKHIQARASVGMLPCVSHIHRLFSLSVISTSEPVSSDYHKPFSTMQVSVLRRGKTSHTILSLRISFSKGFAKVHLKELEPQIFQKTARLEERRVRLSRAICSFL